MPTARFFRDSAPAKKPLIGTSLAGPASADAEALGAQNRQRGPRTNKTQDSPLTPEIRPERVSSPQCLLPDLSLYPIRGTLPLTTEVCMNKSAMIRARVDPTLKDEVEDVFEQLGLSASQAITLFYQQVKLNRGLPFDVRIPNVVTLRTFAETDAGENIVPCENAQDMFARLGI